MRRLTSLACSLVVAGCGGSPPLQQPLGEHVPQIAPFDPPAEILLRGFGEPGPPGIRDGDCLLLGLRTKDEAAGVERVRYARLTVMADVAVRQGAALRYVGTWTNPGHAAREHVSWVTPARLELCEAGGRVTGSSLLLLPTRFLGMGVVDACRAARSAQTDPTPADRIHPVEGGVMALYCAMTRIQEDPLLDDILWEVIERPSLLGVLWNAGVRAALVPDFASARPAMVDIDGREREAERMQVAIKVNGEPAFFAEIVAVEPASPLTATAGIWLIRGHSPSRPDRRFELQVLAARRGSRSGAAAALGPNGRILVLPGATTLEVPE